LQSQEDRVLESKTVQSSGVPHDDGAEEEEEDSWDVKFNEDGDCLDPEALEQVGGPGLDIMCYKRALQAFIKTHESGILHCSILAVFPNLCNVL